MDWEDGGPLDPPYGAPLEAGFENYLNNHPCECAPGFTESMKSVAISTLLVSRTIQQSVWTCQCKEPVSTEDELIDLLADECRE